MAENGAPKNFKEVTHCIFDMDGLLLDTERLYTQAIQGILDKFGKTLTWDVKLSLMGLHHDELAQRLVQKYALPISWEEYSQQQKAATKSIMINAELMPDTETVYQEIVTQILGTFNKDYPIEVRLKILGTTERKSAEIIVNEMELPITVDEYLVRFTELSKQMLGYSPLLKGAERLLRHLHANNVSFALATSSSAEMVEIKIARHREIFKLFSHMVCGSTDPDVKEGKPAPDIFLVACSRFADKPEPSKCLVFEDAPNGVQGAKSAGMQVVMVPDPRISQEIKDLATQWLNSLEEFKPEEFGLPPFTDVDCEPCKTDCTC